ncbi:T9SS type A sorting domain-containing protein, partial [Chryseobacterium sp. VD8]|uniref:T9SS type A sorting domain-containing protein n=1 Tax=Chryseobacterium sp. VD8 TaxID=3081254 RepID=UPI0030189249
SNQIKEYATAQETGVSFSNFSSSVPINVNLNDDEKLTLVTVMDGGFDISTAVVQKNANTATDNTLSFESIKLTPNPAKDYVDVNINLEKSELITLRIISSLGKISSEKSQMLNSGKQSIRLSTEQLLPGTYIVEIKSSSKTTSQKLLITR